MYQGTDSLVHKYYELYGMGDRLHGMDQWSDRECIPEKLGGTNNIIVLCAEHIPEELSAYALIYESVFIAPSTFHCVM
jgi:hypothetical protein